MSSHKLRKLSRYIPLWKRKIPEYPLYYEGNPQLRVFLPLFWMKVLKPKVKLPPDNVLFETHPQMTKADIKQYLEKIYNLKVLNVRPARSLPEEVFHKTEGFLLDRKIQKKLAFVQLEDTTFEFPELFSTEHKSNDKKDLEQYEQLIKEREDAVSKDWGKRDIPVWFR